MDHIPAGELAREAGSAKSVNVVLLGALIKAFNMQDIDWHQVLRDNLPAKVLDVNLKALDAGMKL